jgi:hypothetical protein
MKRRMPVVYVAANIKVHSRRRSGGIPGGIDVSGGCHLLLPAPRNEYSSCFRESNALKSKPAGAARGISWLMLHLLMLRTRSAFSRHQHTQLTCSLCYLLIHSFPIIASAHNRRIADPRYMHKIKVHDELVYTRTRTRTILPAFRVHTTHACMQGAGRGSRNACMAHPPPHQHQHQHGSTARVAHRGVECVHCCSLTSSTYVQVQVHLPRARVVSPFRPDRSTVPIAMHHACSCSYVPPLHDWLLLQWAVVAGG